MSSNATGGRKTALGVKSIELFLAFALALGCALAYFPSLDGPLFFDDLPNLTENPYLDVDASVFESWRVGSISNESGTFRRPVASVSFALNYAFAGEWSSVALKSTNLLLHILISLVIWRLFRLLLQSPELKTPKYDHHHWALAGLAAAIWLLHPLHVSTVLYAVQRMAQLSALFVVLGLWIFLRYRLRWAEAGATTGEIIAAALWVCLATVLATLSKENGALLPWLVIVVEVVLFRGVWAGRQNAALQRLGFFALSFPVLVVVFAFSVEPSLLDARYDGRDFTLVERLLTQSRMLWLYLSWALLPNLLSLGFYHDDIPVSLGLFQPVTTAISLGVWLCVVVAGLALWKRRRAPLLVFVIAFYLVAHSMESSFWPLEMVYEHRNYLPSVSLCLGMAAAVFYASDRVDWLTPGVSAGFVVLTLGILLALRASHWSDEIGLARHTVINHPESPRAHFFYGNAMFKTFEQREELGLSEQDYTANLVSSRQHFEKMHTLDPSSFAALVMLYQLDTNYFQALPERPDWLAEMVGLARSAQIQPSDRTALKALARFAAEFPDELERERVKGLFAQLILRYPNRAEYLISQEKLAALEPIGREASSREILHRASEARRGGLSAFPHLIIHYGKRDKAAAYEVVRSWMEKDHLRMDLLLAKKLFDGKAPE